MHEKFVKWLFIGVGGVYILPFLWLFNRHFSPFGVWSAEIEAPQVETRLVKGPTPEYRVEVDDTQNIWRIKETPVYFGADAPRKFDTAELEVEFRGEAQIVEVGVVKSQDPWRVESHVLYHKYLEELEWPRIERNGFVLWQREPRYKSVEEFLSDPPNVEEIAVVDVPFRATSSLRDVRLRLLETGYNVSLRGPQDIYFYTAGEAIEVKFLFQDMNRHDGADGVEVKLYRHNLPQPFFSLRGGDWWELVAQESLPDDGIEWGTKESKPARKLIVRYAQPEPGWYRLKVSATDDVFIRRITTNQQKMVWKNTLYLGDEVGYSEGVRPVTVYSNGQGYAVRTPHPESVQMVEFAYTEDRPPNVRRTVLDLSEHNKHYTVQMPREVAGEVAAITVPKGDVVLNSDGFFALSRHAFFLPEPISYVSDLDFDRLGINYVLARYEKMTEPDDDGWRTGSVSMAIHDIDQTEPLQFFIGTPHGQESSLEIAKVKVKLTKPQLTFAKIWRKISEIWQ